MKQVVIMQSSLELVKIALMIENFLSTNLLPKFSLVNLSIKKKGISALEGKCELDFKFPGSTTTECIDLFLRVFFVNKKDNNLENIVELRPSGHYGLCVKFKILEREMEVLTIENYSKFCQFFND